MSYDVQNAAHAFRIVFRTRVGDYFYFLNAVGGHAFEYLLGIVRHHLVGFVVHIYLERTGTVYLYVVLAVDSHHRHFAQHVYHGVGL